MSVLVKREDPKPTNEPIEAVTLNGPSGRGITVRPTRSGSNASRKAVRTVVVLDTSAWQTVKWAATLDDLRTFGQALIDIADGK